MDRKISLYVIEPYPYRKHNFLVPESMRMDIAMDLILDMLSLPHGDDWVKQFLALGGQALLPDRTLHECGLYDGSQLVWLGKKT